MARTIVNDADQAIEAIKSHHELIFQVRDLQGKQREILYTLTKYAVKHHPDAVRINIPALRRSINNAR